MDDAGPTYRWEIDPRDHDRSSWLRAVGSVQNKAVRARQPASEWFLPFGFGCAAAVVGIALGDESLALCIGLLLGMGAVLVVQRRRLGVLTDVLWPIDARDDRSIVVADPSGLRRSGPVLDSRTAWGYYRSVDRVGDVLVLTAFGGREVLPLTALTAPADPDAVVATLAAWIAATEPAGATPPGWAGSA